MSTLDQILGRTPITEDDVVPVVAGARARPASVLRRQEPKDKEEKSLRDRARRSSVIASITGMAESDEEGIIPHDAKRVDPYSTEQIPGTSGTPTNLGTETPSEPSRTNAHGEELIPPTAALVAPDVTPKVFEPVDPSQVPAPPKPTGPPGPATASPATSPATGALDTLLGRQNPSPTPPGAGAPIPVAVESFVQALNPLDI